MMEIIELYSMYHFADKSLTCVDSDGGDGGGNCDTKSLLHMRNITLIIFHYLHIFALAIFC